MTYVITSACIDVRDRSCIEVCPVDCIHFEDEDRMCFVDPVACIDCGVCVGACPVAAIYDEKELAPEDARFKALNARWFEDKPVVRAEIEALKAEAL